MHSFIYQTSAEHRLWHPQYWGERGVVGREGGDSAGGPWASNWPGHNSLSSGLGNER